MALELTTMVSLLNDRAAVAAVGWLITGGALVFTPGLTRRRLTLAATGALLAGALLAMSGADLPRWMLGPLGLSTFAQWIIAAGLVLSRLPPKRDPRFWSFLPLAMVSWQGLGACALAFSVAGTGALEPGQARRPALLIGLALLSLALWVDSNSLSLWGRYGAWFQLTFDQASWAVDLTELGARWAGFGALFTWTIRPRS